MTECKKCHKINIQKAMIEIMGWSGLAPPYRSHLSQPRGKRTVSPKALGILEAVSGERSQGRSRREGGARTAGLLIQGEEFRFPFSGVRSHWDIEPRE